LSADCPRRGHRHRPFVSGSVLRPGALSRRPTRPAGRSWTSRGGDPLREAKSPLKCQRRADQACRDGRRRGRALPRVSPGDIIQQGDEGLCPACHRGGNTALPDQFGRGGAEVAGGRGRASTLGRPAPEREPCASAEARRSIAPRRSSRASFHSCGCRTRRAEDAPRECRAAPAPG